MHFVLRGGLLASVFYIFIHMSEQQKTQHNTQLQHHAFLIQGRKEDVADVITNVITSYGIECTGSPDYWEGEFDTFAIADARALKARQDRRASAGGKKIFVIYTNFFTHEAQNALLKLFEEPTPRTHFFLVLPTCEVLLPTLRSRLFIIGGAGIGEVSNNAQQFTAASLKERLEFLKAIIEAKDKGKAIAFLNELEVHLHTTSVNRSGALTSRDIEALRAIGQARSYLHDRAPSIKMLLEHVALSIPVAPNS